MQIEKMIDAVRDFLDEREYHYEYFAEKDVLKLNFDVTSKLKHAQVFFDFKEDGYLVYVYSPLDGDEKNPDEMLRFLAMVNCCMINGNFEFDNQDGTIRYKIFVDTAGLEELPKEIIDDSIGVGLSMMGVYGDGIAALALGFSDAETEMKKVEAKTED